jgi:N-acetylglucosaminyldiphosphoundecaprenol N-acetyl-beta-D-mannosaminyltransferase
MKIDVLGVPVHAVTIEESVGTIAAWIEAGEKSYVCVTGVHGVMESQRDDAVRDAHRRAGLVVPDGMPLVWCAHYAGATKTGHVRGADLTAKVLAEAERQGWRNYFYGSTDEVLTALQSRLVEMYPNLLIAGSKSPPYRPLTPEERQSYVDAINDARPDIVWVGLSTPKQELWMASNRDALHASALIGVGAAFDFHAGLKPEAPTWVRDSGLEWAYRLFREPKRLARRYLKNNPAFVRRILGTRPRLLTSESPSHHG